MTRKHDLPPLWDDNPVTWGPWQVIVSSWRFHAPLDAQVCRSCGSLAARASCSGLVRHPLAAPLDEFAHRLLVERCTDCGHDTVYDLLTDQSWDLNPSDYGDEGSVDPEKVQGALF